MNANIIKSNFFSKGIEDIYLNFVKWFRDFFTLKSFAS